MKGPVLREVPAKPTRLDLFPFFSGVVQEYRKNGVASFLLDNLVSHLTGNGDPAGGSSVTSDVKALYLHVLTTNFGAISFYETRGFRPHLFLPQYYLIQGTF